MRKCDECEKDGEYRNGWDKCLCDDCYLVLENLWKGNA